MIVESLRACARYGPQFVARARAGLAGLAMLPIDDDLLHAAAGLPPPELRSLDAIHLATALSIGDRLGVMLCYDERLTEAARSAGLPVVSPGMK